MSSRRLTTGLVLAIWLCLPYTRYAAAGPPASYAVREVRAHFYFQESGRFGSLDLLEPTRTLWNTPIGGGDAEKASTVTLISVVLSGPRFGGDTSGAIEFRASAKGRELSTQSVPLSSLYASSGSVTVPFLVFGTGCEQLVFEVRVSGVDAEPSEVHKTIPFTCGE